MRQTLKYRRDRNAEAHLQSVEVSIFDRDIELIQALALVLSVDDDASVRLRRTISGILLSGDRTDGAPTILEVLPVSDRDRH